MPFSSLESQEKSIERLSGSLALQVAHEESQEKSIESGSMGEHLDRIVMKISRKVLKSGFEL